MTERTALNIVLGYPLSYTLSPLIHRVIYQLLGCRAVMLPFAQVELSVIVSVIKERAIDLAAVTMPFKEDILAYVDWMSDEVTAIQATNTLIQRDGALHAYNTDCAGVAHALRACAIAGKRVLLWGAGGAARAAAYYLQQQRAELFCYNRHPERAERLVQIFGGTVVEAAALTRLPYDLIINSIPLGAVPAAKVSFLLDYPFTSQQVVFDMVYEPRETQLLRRARQAGAQVIGGLDMLVGQACGQVTTWLDCALSVTEVTKALDSVSGCARECWDS